MCPNYTYVCPRCKTEAVWLVSIADRDKRGLLCVPCGDESRIVVLTRALDAPALKDFVGSHRDEYTKTGPRK